MRVLTLVLLMLLMPLRAWAGDAMALSMLQGHAPVKATHAMHTDAMADHSDHSDHQDHRGPNGHQDVADTHAGHDMATDDACPSHVACDLCNGPVLSLPLWQGEVTTARHHPAVPLATDFASLVPPRHHKPPIA